MTASNIGNARKQGHILDAIVETKRGEVAAAKADRPEEGLRRLAALARPPLDLQAALTSEPGASVIAEVKKASPSRGLIARDWDPAEMALAYVKGGAVAISCLTDAKYFQGDLSYLALIGTRLEDAGLSAPVLRKDFIVDRYQVWESRAAGADALLLIMSVLSDREYRELAELAYELGMQTLVEVHDEKELERALALEQVVIGVNNRDLRTFHTDIATTRRLRQLVPAHRTLVGESGMKTARDVKSMAEIGCDAILVGESFSQLPQTRRERKVREFVSAGALTPAEN